MSVNLMRAYLRKAKPYAENDPNGKWQRKVDAMSDKQVAAVYKRFLYNGNLNGVRI